ncbi:hypothetical protein SISSUDRAFT_1032657 [Sistotremastrum suecicum HHB10207 ss-3]|uniref:Uncharacterized protein n=1 Tax=Sistotremastrum suecicum HHB10207 ss-3 TaxID=1314776 RepID=A0A166ECI0_9AGAM|nr:hypothetical protein SISSUDRAFT_1032657 [Sistotremastrum suecicum HHB10207 ss-3]
MRRQACTIHYNKISASRAQAFKLREWVISVNSQEKTCLRLYAQGGAKIQDIQGPEAPGPENEGNKHIDWSERDWVPTVAEPRSGAIAIVVDEISFASGPVGVFQAVRTPMGIVDASAIFQRCLYTFLEVIHYDSELPFILAWRTDGEQRVCIMKKTHRTQKIGTEMTKRNLIDGLSFNTDYNIDSGVISRHPKPVPERGIRLLGMSGKRGVPRSVWGVGLTHYECRVTLETFDSTLAAAAVMDD